MPVEDTLGVTSRNRSKEAKKQLTLLELQHALTVEADTSPLHEDNYPRID